MLIESVVGDANVLLSAIAGKAALRVFTEYQVTVHVARFNLDEVVEYLPRMARKYGLPDELLQLQLKLLPFRAHGLESYRHEYSSALSDLAKSDPEDAHALALARTLQLPLWSNDRDLLDFDVTCYPTARLLAMLEGE